MATSKITLAFITLFTVGALSACNGSHDKSGVETETGQPAAHENASGSDTSHTTDNKRAEISGVNSKPDTKSANGTTTAQGMTGGDSVYQKSTQKSQK